MTVVTAVAAAATAAGCDPGFDPVYLVNDLRVLAAQVEPPEVSLAPGFRIPPDVMADMQQGKELDYEALLPDMEFPVALKVLVAAPDDLEVGPLKLKVRGCVLAGDYECREDEPSPLLAQQDAVVGENAVPVAITTEMIAAAARNDRYKGAFGVAVYLRGDLEGEAGGESVAIPFIKGWLFYVDFQGNRVPNHNPRITGILYGEKDAEQPALPSADGAFHVLEDGETRFRPAIPPEDREVYLVTLFPDGEDDAEDAQHTDNGAEGRGRGMPGLEQEERDEEMTASFYCTCGKFSDHHASERLNPVLETEEDKKDKDLSVTWTPDEAGQRCTLWFVADDGRAGVGWSVMQVAADLAGAPREE